MERNLVMIAMFAALIAALGVVPPISLASGVPITAQTLAVMLCGTVLGAQRGALAVLLFLLLVALGLPLLSGGRGGLGVFAAPSVGFLIGWPIGAFITGYIVQYTRGFSVLISATLGSVIGGIVILYIPGIIGLSLMLDKSLSDATLISAAYLPGDAIKAALAGFLTAAIYKARPSSVLSRA